MSNDSKLVKLFQSVDLNDQATITFLIRFIWACPRALVTKGFRPIIKKVIAQRVRHYYFASSFVRKLRNLIIGFKNKTWRVTGILKKFKADLKGPYRREVSALCGLKEPPLTRSNMTNEEMVADDKVWADWFQQHSWKSITCDESERPALKREIDFMAKQRIIGNHFDVASKAYAQSGGA